MATPNNSKMIRFRKHSPRGLITLLCIPLTCAAFTWIGMRVSRAYVAAQEMHKVNDAIESRYLEMKQQNNRLESEVKAYQTKEGLTRAARRLGWVNPGEVHMHIP